MTSSLREAIRQFVRTYCARLVQLLPINRSSANRYDGVDGQESAGDEPEGQRTVERMQHYGFRSRPRAPSRCVVLQVNGGAGNNVSVAEETDGLGPTDQKDGEVELYSEYGQRIRFLQDQHLRVDAPGVAEVLVNGGSAKVARVNDGIWASDLRVEVTSDGGMPPKDVITISVISLDPQDPAYLSPVQLAKFKVQAGDAQFPPMLVPFQTRLRGVIVRGADRFKA